MKIYKFRCEDLELMTFSVEDGALDLVEIKDDITIEAQTLCKGVIYDLALFGQCSNMEAYKAKWKGTYYGFEEVQ